MALQLAVEGQEDEGGGGSGEGEQARRREGGILSVCRRTSEGEEEIRRGESDIGRGRGDKAGGELWMPVGHFM